jgi:hypothetical protein
MLIILFFKQTISHLKQKFYKFKSTLNTWGLHVLCFVFLGCTHLNVHDI